MQNLLNTQEERRFEFVKLLSAYKDWITLDQISEELEIPTRTLKEDIRFLNNYFQNSRIETSVNGIRIRFGENYGAKTFCQYLLRDSRNYQLLETIFLHEGLSVNELAGKIFMSPATIYRLINQMNPLLEEQYGFSISTSPCKFVGDEERIRFYFYTYFFERYRYSEWPFVSLPQESFNEVAHLLIKNVDFDVDFAYFNVFKVIMAVNLTRYLNGNMLDVAVNEKILNFFLHTLQTQSEKVQAFEKQLNIKMDRQAVVQIFTQYMALGLFFSPDTFAEGALADPVFGRQVQGLRGILMGIAEKYELSVENLDFLVYFLFGTGRIEYQEPQSNYILYDRNYFFAREVSRVFPDFYTDLFEGMYAFRELVGKPLTDSGAYFYVYTIFTWWKDLVPQLQERAEKVRILVVSDRHLTHARMIADFIRYEFGKRVIVENFSGLLLDELTDYTYDILVPTFTITGFEDERVVSVSNVPNYGDFLAIQHHIDEVVMARNGQVDVFF